LQNPRRIAGGRKPSTNAPPRAAGGALGQPSDQAEAACDCKVTSQSADNNQATDKATGQAEADDQAGHDKVTSHTADPGGADEQPRRPIRPNELPDDPSRLARLFIRKHCRHPDGSTLLFWQGEWVEWVEAAWRPVLEQDIRARSHQITKKVFDILNQQEIARWEKLQAEAAAEDVTTDGKDKKNAKE
jgi:hypothetical protein